MKRRHYQLCQIANASTLLHVLAKAPLFIVLSGLSMYTAYVWKSTIRSSAKWRIPVNYLILKKVSHPLCQSLMAVMCILTSCTQMKLQCLKKYHQQLYQMANFNANTCFYKSIIMNSAGWQMPMQIICVGKKMATSNSEWKRCHHNFVSEIAIDITHVVNRSHPYLCQIANANRNVCVYVNGVIISHTNWQMPKEIHLHG